jgi:tRNA pseudouridine55 synthase
VSTTSGILLVDKAGGLTSHGVAARARRLLGTKKIGHAGTLDPMATGLLLLGVNSATRLLTFFVGLDKEYTATIRIGAASTTDDAEGELLPKADAAALAALTLESLQAGVARLTGAISQRPSSVSAIKVDGKRAYTRVREGEEVVLAERAVTISAFEILDVRRGDWVDVDVRVECSSGTYIRALARDLGADLGLGAHLTVLRRTRIGPFALADAVDIDDVTAADLMPPARAAARVLATFEVDAETAVDLGHGKPVTLDAPEGVVAVIAPGDRLVGVVEVVAGRANILMNVPTGEALP